MPYAVIACSIIFFWVISLRAYLFTVLPTIAAELGILAGAAGMIIAATSFGYTLAMWSAGFLPGRPRRVIFLGIGVSILAMVGVGLAPGLWPLFLFSVVAGVGSGVYLPLGLAIIVGASRPERRARSMSLHEVAASAGYFAGAGFVAVSLPLMSWREATLLWCLVGVLGLISLYFMRSDPLIRHSEAPPQRLQFDRRLLASMIVFGACQVILTGLISVLPLLLVDGWGIEQTEVAAVISWSRLAGFVGIALAGLSSGRLRAKLAVQLFLLVAALCTGAMIVLPYGPGFVVAIYVLSVAASGAIVLVSVVVAEAYQASARTRALSIGMGFSGLLALAVLPAVFGWLIELQQLRAPFLITTAFSTLALFSIGILKPAEEEQVVESKGGPTVAG